jgi:hypothetical protein
VKQAKFFDEGGPASNEDRLLYDSMSDIKEQYALQEAQIKNAIAEGFKKADIITETKRLNCYI